MTKIPVPFSSKEKDILPRIESLVLIAAVLFFIMFMLDILRRRIHNPIIKKLFTTLDNVSDSIVIYILGAMQTSPIKNQLFPVWAIVLVNFRNSVDFISGYGVVDKAGRRFTEWRNVMKLLGIAFLYRTRGSNFKFPLWSLWAMQILRSFYRLQTRGLALKSVWHGGSSSLISEYMRTDREPGNFKLENCDPQTMEGYKYLIYGEAKQSIKLQKPQYAICIDASKKRRPMFSRFSPRNNSTTCSDALTTLDKIWQCDGQLLNPDNSKGDDLKDLSLAFALSRLLRCRLEGVPLHADALRVNQKLIKSRILVDDPENAKRTFSIIEVQLAFLSDYFNTRYPMVFWNGLPSMILSLILSMVNFGIVCWLSVDIRRVQKPPVGDTAHLLHGHNVSVYITWFFMCLMMIKEMWEICTYLRSDWTSLLITCIYQRMKCQYMRNRCTESVLPNLFSPNIEAKRWHQHIDQYVFLQSYDASPKVWNLFYNVSCGMLPKKDEGADTGDAINIPDYVKSAIMEKVASLELDHGFLPKTMISLTDIDGHQRSRYRWACFELPTCSHIVLVWHIATCLCELQLAKEHDVDLGKQGFLCSLFSYITFCFPSKPYLVDEEELPGDLKKNYIIANSLSRYCAYLLISKPELIPDRFLVPKKIFQATMYHARDHMLKECDSLDKRFEKLMEEAKKAGQGTDKKSTTILQLGARLGYELIDGDNAEMRWRCLADVWAELLVHIAPSWNAAAHKECLESGTEFITHIWSLLWHCGIEKSNLWPVDDMRENSAKEAYQSNNTDNNQYTNGTVNSGNNGVELAAVSRVVASEDDERLPNVAIADGGHWSGLVNTHGNVVRKMKNLGNTCYFNAVLQSLLALDNLRAIISGTDALTGPLCQELKNLFMETNNATDTGGTLVPEKLFTIMCSRNPDFRISIMEDSSNLLRFLLDGLKNENSGTFESLFYGQVAKYVSSRECEHTSTTTEEHVALSLAIPSKEHVSIEDCLDLYATGEIRDWLCTYCSSAAAGIVSSNQSGTALLNDDDQTGQPGSKTHQKEQLTYPTLKQISRPNQDKRKLTELTVGTHQMGQSQEEGKIIYRAAEIKYRIYNAPLVLIIQLKRFGYVQNDGSHKLGNLVSFKETLDITDFMDTRHTENEDYTYRLVAVIVHDGKELDEGHFWAYVRLSRIGGKQESDNNFSWVRANDEDVKPASLNDVLSCQAYILFYERIGNSEPVTSEGRKTNEIQEDCDKEKTQTEGGVMSSEDAGEGIASVTSTKSENSRKGNVMSRPEQQMSSRKDMVKSRDGGLELVATRITEYEGKNGMPKVAAADEGHRLRFVTKHGNVVIGMENLGNTCYFNAVLQSVLALDNVRAWMLAPGALTGSLGQELKNICIKTSSASDEGGLLVPENLFKIMCSSNSNFRLGTMEDSYIMLTSLLDGLYTEEPGIVESLFYGQVAKQVCCKVCVHTSCTKQNLDLSLAIPSKKSVSIEDCLELYGTENIEGWHCTNCSAAGNTSSNETETKIFDDDQHEQSDSKAHQKGRPSHPPNQDERSIRNLNGDTHQMEQSHKEEAKIYTAAEIKYRICKAPPVLTIQLKRFDYISDKSYKLGKYVSFEETLDITKFMDSRHKENEDYIYRLVAVIVHHGEALDKGHFLAYVKGCRIGGKQQDNYNDLSWVCAIDEVVKPVSLNEVLSCQAYILFYERLEHSEATTSPGKHLTIDN